MAFAVGAEFTVVRHLQLARVVLYILEQTRITILEYNVVASQSVNQLLEGAFDNVQNLGCVQVVLTNFAGVSRQAVDLVASVYELNA